MKMIKTIWYLITNFRNFLNWCKESKKPEFKIIENITNCYLDILPLLLLRSGKISSLIDLRLEYEEENKKEYSELKYQLVEKHNRLIQEMIDESEIIKEKMLLSYYSIDGGDLVSDIEVGLEYLKISKYFDNKDKEILNNVKEGISNSNLTKQMDENLKYF